VAEFGALFNGTGRGRSLREKGYWPNIRSTAPNSIAGYMPYVKNGTKLIVHNFWSANYGIRKQLLGQVTLLGEHGRYVDTFRIALPANQVTVIEFTDQFGEQDSNTMVLELFHPRFPYDHACHGGHVRF
jgi:hypothetical protein